MPAFGTQGRYLPGNSIAGVAPAPSDRNYLVDTAVADAFLPNQRPIQ